MKELHGWYSPRQFAAVNTNQPKNKHLYYINEKGVSVEVTMVSGTLEHGCNFDDISYVGKLDKFHKLEYKFGFMRCLDNNPKLIN